MSNTTTSPNMGLPVPNVGTETGPAWATDTNACWSIVDGHTHASGSGVPITPGGLNINSDLTFAGNNATNLKSTRFTAQGSPLSSGADIGCLYVSGVDLYYNDENGNQVRITQSGSVTGSSGTITGLPSGTASAAFAAGTFTFQSATNTPATMAVGPLVIGRSAALSKTVTLAPDAAQASNFDVTFPPALPASEKYMTLDSTGGISFNSFATTGSGGVVLSTSPTITAPTFAGVPAGTITAASFSPTLTWTHVTGGTVTVTVNTSTWTYQRVGNVVTVFGRAAFTTSAYTGTIASYTISATLPIATASLVNTGTYLTFSFGTGVVTNFLLDVSNTAVTTTTVDYGSNSSSKLDMSYSYLVS